MKRNSKHVRGLGELIEEVVIIMRIKLQEVGGNIANMVVRRSHEQKIGAPNNAISRTNKESAAGQSRTTSQIFGGQWRTILEDYIGKEERYSEQTMKAQPKTSPKH